MATIVWTEEAERWLRKIHDYIARDKPAAAFNVVESIYRRVQILADFPQLGHTHKSPSSISTGGKPIILVAEEDTKTF